MDFIFTVCDNAAGETCPVWPGRPMTAHWGIEDPAAIEGDGQRMAFLEALRQLRGRIELFLALPLESLDEMSLARDLRAIGDSQSDMEHLA
jgi:arsenate reductase